MADWLAGWLWVTPELHHILFIMHYFWKKSALYRECVAIWDTSQLSLLTEGISYLSVYPEPQPLNQFG